MRSRPGPGPLPIPEPWGPLVADYIASLAAIGRPDTTIATRRSHIARLARTLDRSPHDVTYPDLRDWFAAHRGNWSRETHRSYRNSVVSFFQWAHSDGMLPANPAADMPSISPDRPVPRPTPDRVWRKAKMAADPRVMLMLRLASEAGLRRAEVAQVHTSDLREGPTGRPVLLVHGKGKRERLLPTTDDLADAIEAGAAGHTPGASRTGWLFPNGWGSHLSRGRVGELCSNVMPGIWTMHTLRHRFASKGYAKTKDLRAIQELLGHSSVAVTQTYTAVDDDDLRAVMTAAAHASAAAQAS